MQNFNVDVSSPGGPLVYYAMQADSLSRFFTLTITDNGEAWNPPSGALWSVRFGAPQMPSGWYDTITEVGGETHPAIDVSENVATVEIAEQALESPGQNILCVLVTDSTGYQIASWPIILSIQAVPGLTAPEVTTYYNLLTGQVAQVLQNAQAAAGSATAAASSAELSQSWAVGGTGSREGEDTNNSEYWAQQSQAAANNRVASFNGRTGAVMPQEGDYDAADVGALALTGGTVSGVVALSQGYYVFDTTGTPGETGYINIATITINNTYQNAVIAFRFIRRGKKAPSTVFISFQNQNTTDPNINQFIYSGDAQPSEFGLYKSSPGVWNLYVQKTEPYDDVAVTLLETCHGLMKTTISFGSEQVSSLPDESINPTYYNPASILETPVKIGNASFDGSKNITLSEIGALAANGTAVACSGNSATATKLATARKIGNASFNGAADITLAQIGALPALAFGSATVDIKNYNSKSNPYTTPGPGWVTIGSATNSVVAIAATNYPYPSGYLATVFGSSTAGGITTIFVPAGAKIFCNAISGTVDHFQFISAT